MTNSEDNPSAPKKRKSYNSIGSRFYRQLTNISHLKDTLAELRSMKPQNIHEAVLKADKVTELQKQISAPREFGYSLGERYFQWLDNIECLEDSLLDLQILKPQSIQESALKADKVTALQELLEEANASFSGSNSQPTDKQDIMRSPPPAPLVAGGGENPPEFDRPAQLIRQRIDAIEHIVRELGHDPKNLPDDRKAGPKGGVRKKVCEMAMNRAPKLFTSLGVSQEAYKEFKSENKD